MSIMTYSSLFRPFQTFSNQKIPHFSGQIKVNKGYLSLIKVKKFAEALAPLMAYALTEFAPSPRPSSSGRSVWNRVMDRGGGTPAATHHCVPIFRRILYFIQRPILLLDQRLPIAHEPSL